MKQYNSTRWTYRATSITFVFTSPGYQYEVDAERHSLAHTLRHLAETKGEVMARSDIADLERLWRATLVRLPPRKADQYKALSNLGTPGRYDHQPAGAQQ